MFDHKAVIHVPREEVLQSAVSDPMELAIEVGAEDVIISSKSDESGDGIDDAHVGATKHPCAINSWTEPLN